MLPLSTTTTATATPTPTTSSCTPTLQQRPSSTLVSLFLSLDHIPHRRSQGIDAEGVTHASKLGAEGRVGFDGVGMLEGEGV